MQKHGRTAGSWDGSPKRQSLTTVSLVTEIPLLLAVKRFLKKWSGIAQIKSHFLLRKDAET